MFCGKELVVNAYNGNALALYLQTKGIPLYTGLMRAISVNATKAKRYNITEILHDLTLSTVTALSN